MGQHHVPVERPKGAIWVLLAASVAIPRAVSRVIRLPLKNPRSIMSTLESLASPLDSYTRPLKIRSAANPLA